jgi:membrane associated rhomboid family serine protease
MFIPVGTDLKLKKFPWATFLLIAINTTIYFAFGSEKPDWMLENFAFVLTQPNHISLITHIFLHGNFFHLFFNMLFLWVFGANLEDKIGWKKYLIIYFISGFFSVILFSLIEQIFHSPLKIPLIGASGAISGIMAAYLMRCYYSKIKFVVDVFGLFFIPRRFRVNAMVLIGLDLLINLYYGFSELKYDLVLGGVAWWGHIGGFLAGFLLAKVLKFKVEGKKERLLKRAMENLERETGLAQAREDLLKILELEPDNVEAHCSLARLYAGGSDFEKGESYYRKAILMLLKKKDKSVIGLCKEYFQNYRSSLAPEIQFKACQYLYRQGEFDLAARGLELLIEQGDPKDPWVEKAYIYQAKILRENLGLTDAALHVYDSFFWRYPGSKLREKVRAVCEGLGVVVIGN